ncbi:Peptidyl-prolyl cis-trans isomerase fpr2 [Rhizoclosmatium sp. JEL0117]|nr:Peptidyl-prolyl cis-trans isomerase fpr2 [Rhizoclosmatium sp. JEL0117]
MRFPAVVLALASFVSAGTSSSKDVAAQGVNQVIPIEELHIETIKAVPEAECTYKTQRFDELTVHYDGFIWETGRLFDSTHNRESPFKFYLGRLEMVLGFDKGLFDMCVGEKRKLSIPSQLGFGSRGYHGFDISVPPNTDLVYEVELLKVVPYSNKENPKEEETKQSEDEKGTEL